MAKSELDTLISEIKTNAKQVSINKIDEVKVMKSMLNDKQFKLAVYDKNDGFIGERCPALEATEFVKNIIQGATGLDAKDSANLADSYEFTKKDASFMISNAKDFIEVYMRTGRKLNVLQNGASDASIFTRDMKATKKVVPSKDGSSDTKEIKTVPFVKLVSVSKSPKYLK